MKPFSLVDAMRKLDGRAFSVRELEDALAQLRVTECRGYLPADIGVRELLDVAHERNWLKEETDGRLRVVLNATPAPEKGDTK